MTSYNEIIQACARDPAEVRVTSPSRIFWYFPSFSWVIPSNVFKNADRFGLNVHVVIGSFTSISETLQGSSPGKQTTASNQSESRPFHKRHSCRVLVLIHKQAINSNGRERVEQAGQNPQLITHRINRKRRQPCLIKEKKKKTAESGTLAQRHTQAWRWVGLWLDWADHYRKRRSLRRNRWNQPGKVLSKCRKRPKSCLLNTSHQWVMIQSWVGSWGRWMRSTSTVGGTKRMWHSDMDKKKKRKVYKRRQ